MNKKSILKANQSAPGIKLNGYNSIGDSQPPKNKNDPKIDLKL